MFHEYAVNIRIFREYPTAVINHWREGLEHVCDLFSSGRKTGLPVK